MPPLEDSLAIENVVASTDLTVELDLTAVAQEFDHVSYNPDNFPGLIFRIPEPTATALVFRSGKLVITGAQSVADVTEAVQVTAAMIRELGLAVPADLEITVHNIVVSGDLGYALNLSVIAIGLGLEHVEYEPEQFPGLVYRMDDPSVVMLLFGSGKAIIVGCKRLEDAEAAITALHDRLIDLGLVD
jgi:transcription initiation factor TFIID TATA-box-binding protein